MKRFIIIAMSVIMVLSLVSCSERNEKPVEESTNSASTQLPNPFVECDNLEEAEKAAGFGITAPNSIPNWVSDTKIRVMKDEMIEIIYSGEDQQKLCVRKGIGSEDISGHYESYEKTSEISAGDITVTVKGNGDKIHVAVWTSGDYSFAITDKNGLSEENIKNMVAHIK